MAVNIKDFSVASANAMHCRFIQSGVGGVITLAFAYTGMTVVDVIRIVIYSIPGT